MKALELAEFRRLVDQVRRRLPTPLYGGEESDYQLDVEVLSGGLTNSNVLLTARFSQPDGEAQALPLKLVVRCFSAFATLHLAINRSHESYNSQQAHRFGVGAAVLLAPEDQQEHAGGQTMALEYIEGKCLAQEDVQRACSDEVSVKRLADTIRRLHRRGKPEELLQAFQEKRSEAIGTAKDGSGSFRGRFDIESARQTYLEVIRSNSSELPQDYKRLEEVHTAMLTELQKHHGETLVPCHNDLLAANFIDTSQPPAHSSGNKQDSDGRIVIIDWEYSGLNYPSFDLGNLASECRLDERQIANLVRAYWLPEARASGDVESFLAAKKATAQLWAIAAQMAWVAWSVIVGRRGSGEGEAFDYATWGKEKLSMAQAALEDSERTAQLLEAVRRLPGAGAS